MSHPDRDLPPAPAPIIPLRRRTDVAPLSHPAFTGAVALAWDYVVDNGVRAIRVARRGEEPAAPERLEYVDVRGLCRHFLENFIALGGKL